MSDVSPERTESLGAKIPHSLGWPHHSPDVDSCLWRVIGSLWMAVASLFQTGLLMRFLHDWRVSLLIPGLVKHL